MQKAMVSSYNSYPASNSRGKFSQLIYTGNYRREFSCPFSIKKEDVGKSSREKMQETNNKQNLIQLKKKM